MSTGSAIWFLTGQNITCQANFSSDRSKYSKNSRVNSLKCLKPSKHYNQARFALSMAKRWKVPLHGLRVRFIILFKRVLSAR